MDTSARIIRRLSGLFVILLLATCCTSGETADSPSIDDTPWTLIRFTIDGEPLPIPETITPTLTFYDSRFPITQDGGIAFGAGCNPVSVGYKLRDGMPVLEGVIVHRLMYCGDSPGGEEAMDLEDAFAESLASWASQRIDGDEWIITYEGGEIVFRRESTE